MDTKINNSNLSLLTGRKLEFTPCKEVTPPLFVPSGNLSDLLAGHRSLPVQNPNDEMKEEMKEEMKFQMFGMIFLPVALVGFVTLPKTSLALFSGLAGYGLGTLFDHAVGWIRDDGRSLTDLMSGANAGVPVADPTGHGGTGWRFVADEK